MQSQVTVYHLDGSAATRTKTAMNIQGLFSGGWCKEANTDSRGVALIGHSSKGTGETYIYATMIGTMKVQGGAVFTI